MGQRPDAKNRSPMPAQYICWQFPAFPSIQGLCFDIIVNLQMKNDFYWLIKHFDDQTLDHIRSRFDKESGMAFMNTFFKASAK